MKIPLFDVDRRSSLDTACAKAGGISCIAVVSGMYSMKELEEAGAELVIKSLLEKRKNLRFFKLIVTA